MDSDLILCLDSGTTSVKAAVYDQNGTCLAHFETPNGALARAGNRVEQDMDQTLAEAEQAIVACVAKTGGGITALAITAQGDGLWPLTVDFAPAGQAITWLDGRASELVSEMPDELDEIEQITGARPTSASQTLQLLWLQANEPEKFASIRYALRLKEWLFYAMTGSLCAEYGSVLPVWGDWRTRQASQDIPAVLGLSKGVDLLPDIGPVTSCIAGLSKQAAARLGLPTGLRVVLGPGDVQSSLVGLGVGAGLPLTSGSVFGTSAIHGAYYSDIDQLPDLRAGAMVQRAATGEGFICFHPCFNGGTVLRHMSELLGTAMPATYAPAYSGVVVLPFFEPGGERAPVNDPLASAAMFGLGADTTQDQINWATREALAFLTRMSHTELKQGEQTAIAVGGGVARDPMFLQLLASTLQRPVQAHIGGDTALRGLAATAMGVLDQGAQPGLPKFSYLAAPCAEIQPETGAVPAYLDHKYDLFETLLSSTSKAWPELAKAKANAEVLG